MPEGDTIYRTAAVLRTVMELQKIEKAESPNGSVVTDGLQPATIDSVEARGKHLLMHLEGGMTIHSHMGMTGSWHVYRATEIWHKPRRQAALALTFGDPPRRQVVCFSPKLLELLSGEVLRRHRWLSRLGPDLLGARFDVRAAVARFRRHPTKAIGEAIMDQSIVCGVGNVYKSELLFLEQLHPVTSVERLSDEQLRRLLSRSRALMRQNLEGYPRRTRFGIDGSRTWVYGRSGQACLKCATVIRIRRQGDLGRTTYWCPNCQSQVNSDDVGH